MVVGSLAVASENTFSVIIALLPKEELVPLTSLMVCKCIHEPHIFWLCLHHTSNKLISRIFEQGLVYPSMEQ